MTRPRSRAECGSRAGDAGAAPRNGGPWSSRGREDILPAPLIGAFGYLRSSASGRDTACSFRRRSASYNLRLCSRWRPRDRGGSIVARTLLPLPCTVISLRSNARSWTAHGQRLAHPHARAVHEAGDETLDPLMRLNTASVSWRLSTTGSRFGFLDQTTSTQSIGFRSTSRYRNSRALSAWFCVLISL